MHNPSCTVKVIVRGYYVCSARPLETILVADDNEDSREVLSAMLSAAGYQVVCAADGQQALARVDSNSIDLALLDVMMPHPTGFRNLSGDEV